MHVRRWLCAVLSVVTASALVALPAGAAEEPWGPLEEAGGTALAVALDDGTTVVLSTGGPDEATVYDQRRSPGGVLGPAVEVMTVEDATSCQPVEAVTARGNLAVAVECQAETGLEDPPTRLAALVWTGDDGWVWQVRSEGDLGSLDYSPRGQHVLFTTNSQYGRPHHLTSYHADLGWRDLTRRERGLSGDDLVAAISDSGDLVALRGAGFEDEPGYWFGGRLRVETYDAASGRWTQRLDRRYPDGGIDPTGVDLAGGRLVATVVESRSTGRLHGREDRVVVLSGRSADLRTWESPRWSRQVLTARAATTRAGVGVAGWHAVEGRRTAQPWFATWAPQRPRPSVHALGWRTTLTDAAEAGRAMDLSVSSGGQGAIAYVRHRRGADHSSVAGASFRVTRDGDLTDQVDATWQQPVHTTVDVTASAGWASITLGRMDGPFVQSPLVRYSVRPAGARS